MNKASRYSRQIILSEIGAEGQEKISEARVLVVGAGGLGCPALQYLAAAGIGSIGIVDHDRVDVSNLQRQTLYTTADQGKPKAAAARERLLQMNPVIEIRTYEEELTSQNVLGLFSAYDLVIDGTDNFAAKFLINDAAVKTGRPFIYGAIQGFDGQASVFDAAKGPCYRCLHPEPPRGIILNCAEAGVIGALAGIVGSIQAMEAIKIIVDDESFSPLIGKLWMIDTRAMETRMLKIARRKDCSVCARAPGDVILPNYSPVCLSAMPEEIDWNSPLLKNAVLIDVRELHEWEAGHIAGALHMPLSVLQKNPDAFEKPGPAPCVLYCQRGGRSKKAAELLLSTGFQGIYSLKGGYAAWGGEKKG